MSQTLEPTAAASLVIQRPAGAFLRPEWHPVDPRCREQFDALVRSFVPPDSFDAHAHAYQISAMHVPGVGVEPGMIDAVGWSTYRAGLEAWMGDRTPAGALLFPLPSSRAMDVAASNALIVEQVRRASSCRGLMFIGPQDDPQAVEAALDPALWAGFKVYHTFAPRENTFHAPTEEFLPEWAWELAHRHGLQIMLHMVLPRALADARNQQYIRSHCLKYPGATLVLAHAARGFNARHTVEGIASLRRLDNVYFDTSAVCESEAMRAIIAAFGTRRLMFGTDYPICNLRGRCSSTGDGFHWLYHDNTDWAASPTADPSLVGIESLLALQQATQALHLRDDDIERLFRGNALTVLAPFFEAGEATPAVRQGPVDLDPAIAAIGAADAQEGYAWARKHIPGGVSLLSKRPELAAPDRWPPYFSEAHGVELIDGDGRRYLDMTTMGIGACLLGYADPDVNAAVLRRVTLGSMSTLNSPEDLELAQTLLSLHPWAGMVRYARTGGEAMMMAVRIARAYTGRDQIAVCGYHGWHDWYLAANLTSGSDAGAAGPGQGQLAGHLLPGLEPVGVPAGLAGTTHTFTYNRLDQLEAVIRKHGSKLAAIVMEPTRGVHPEPGFLEAARDLAHGCGAVLVFDEITVGFRLATAGAHLRYGVNPDLAVYAKALGNGFPMAALVGTEPVMQASQASFISSTLWTEGVGPTAALAVLKKLMRVDVPAHLHRIGESWRVGFEALARKHGVPLKLSGHPAASFVSFDHPEAAALTTMLTVRMLRHGILAGGGFYVSLAHEDRHVARYLEAADQVLPELREAIDRGDVAGRIGSPVKHTGFARLT